MRVFIDKRFTVIAVAALVLYGCAPSNSPVGVSIDGGGVRVGAEQEPDWSAALGPWIQLDGVDYRSLAKNVAVLEGHVAGLSRQGPKSDPEAFHDRNQRLAYWLNAYNAAVVLAVVQAGVPESMHDPAATPFRDRVRLRIDGRSLTLNDIREIIAVESNGDPRVWLCINDAARGSPPIGDRPFEAETLEVQLAEAARRAMGDPHLVKVDHESGELHVGVPLIEHRDALIDYCRRATGKADADLLDAVISLAGTMRGAWFANARGYPVKIIPFDSTLNLSADSE